ncbi:Uncharacterized protein APZ42_020834 [Daphnia magna]|uniref:Uncharacterized protein n=1 Tax=Daphnia magna TaxID=35525 RepID=A0A164XEJ9_9CRUS|nr:Uncharacterized protein APZ42_020834 [Daphnia magna]
MSKDKGIKKKIFMRLRRVGTSYLFIGRSAIASPNADYSVQKKRWQMLEMEQRYRRWISLDAMQCCRPITN